MLLLSHHEKLKFQLIKVAFLFSILLFPTHNQTTISIYGEKLSKNHSIEARIIIVNPMIHCAVPPHSSETPIAQLLRVSVPESSQGSRSLALTKAMLCFQGQCTSNDWLIQECKIHSSSILDNV